MLRFTSRTSSSNSRFTNRISIHVQVITSDTPLFCSLFFVPLDDGNRVERTFHAKLNLVHRSTSVKRRSVVSLAASPVSMVSIRAFLCTIIMREVQLYDCNMFMKTRARRHSRDDVARVRETEATFKRYIRVGARHVLRVSRRARRCFPRRYR